MTVVPITQFHNYLASEFEKETAENHIIHLEQNSSKAMENNSQLPATKEDLQRVFSLLATKEDLQREVSLLATKDQFISLEKEVNRIDLKTSETKVDLIKGITSVKADLTNDIASLKADLTMDITSVKVDLTKDISVFKADIIKWMFIFWVGQAGIVIAVLLHFLMK